MAKKIANSKNNSRIRWTDEEWSIVIGNALRATEMMRVFSSKKSLEDTVQSGIAKTRRRQLFTHGRGIHSRFMRGYLENFDRLEMNTFNQEKNFWDVFPRYLNEDGSINKLYPGASPLDAEDVLPQARKKTSILNEEKISSKRRLIAPVTLDDDLDDDLEEGGDSEEEEEEEEGGPEAFMNQLPLLLLKEQADRLLGLNVRKIILVDGQGDHFTLKFPR